MSKDNNSQEYNAIDYNRFVFYLDNKSFDEAMRDLEVLLETNGPKAAEFLESFLSYEDKERGTLYDYAFKEGHTEFARFLLTKAETYNISPALISQESQIDNVLSYIDTLAQEPVTIRTSFDESSRSTLSQEMEELFAELATAEADPTRNRSSTLDLDQLPPAPGIEELVNDIQRFARSQAASLEDPVKNMTYNALATLILNPDPSRTPDMQEAYFKEFIEKNCAGYDFNYIPPVEVMKQFSLEKYEGKSIKDIAEKFNPRLREYMSKSEPLNNMTYNALATLILNPNFRPTQAEREVYFQNFLKDHCTGYDFSYVPPKEILQKFSLEKYAGKSIKDIAAEHNPNLNHYMDLAAASPEQRQEHRGKLFTYNYMYHALKQENGPSAPEYAQQISTLITDPSFKPMPGEASLLKIEGSNLPTAGELVASFKETQRQASLAPKKNPFERFIDTLKDNAVKDIIRGAVKDVRNAVKNALKEPAKPEEKQPQKIDRDPLQR